MKLASLKSTNSRDGKLIIVSKTLETAVLAQEIAPTLQYALDNWQTLAAKLEKKYTALNNNSCADAFPFDPHQVCAPLPRAYQWLDASAYVNHVELVRKSRNVEMPQNFWTDPLMYQGGSDSLIGACDDILVASTEWGVDFEAEVAVITDDVPMGIIPADATQHIKLLMLVNDVSLRNLAMPELSKGFGFLQCKPATAFAPVAVTPDELENAWKDGKVNLPIISQLNGQLFGQPNAGQDMTFNFPTLIAHAAKTRFLAAGTIIGSGTVSNTDRSKGSSCIVEKRMLETIANGKPSSQFMQFGDTVTIEMLDSNNVSIFGAIAQTVKKYNYL